MDKKIGMKTVGNLAFVAALSTGSYLLVDGAIKNEKMSGMESGLKNAETQLENFTRDEYTKVCDAHEKRTEFAECVKIGDNAYKLAIKNDSTLAGRVKAHESTIAAVRETF
jgi:hypothetical protein